MTMTQKICERGSLQVGSNKLRKPTPKDKSKAAVEEQMLVGFFL